MEEVIAGRYAVGAELGRGGMARVVAARDLRLRRAVAIKLLPADPPTDPASRQRFIREARAAASFSHPHAVAVFDAGDADGVLYLVMELVDGPSLASVLSGHHQLDIDDAVRIADQVLQALGAAHRAGIVHRDVKPGNVLITSDGAAKLADFGIAKRLDDLGKVTATGQFIGTPTYLAPEQVAGQPATAATDLYATGVLLFEMLAGGPPFDAGTPLATALAHRDAPVPDVRARRPEVPTTVAETVRRAMAKDPAARFASAEQMRAVLRGAPLLVPPLQPTARMPAAQLPAAVPNRSFLARSWWWLAAAGALLAVVVVAVTQADDPDAGPPATTTAAQPTPTTDDHHRAHDHRCPDDAGDHDDRTTPQRRRRSSPCHRRSTWPWSCSTRSRSASGRGPTNCAATWSGSPTVGAGGATSSSSRTASPSGPRTAASRRTPPRSSPPYWPPPPTTTTRTTELTPPASRTVLNRSRRPAARRH